MEPTETPKVNKRNAPLDPEDYARVKANYPNVKFNDEDQSFITKKGTVSYARRLKFFRPWQEEDLAKGRAVVVERNKNNWERFLEALRNGMRPGEAAKKVNLRYDTVRKRYNSDPEFRAQWDQAEMQAAEPVEDSLYNAAINGNVPAAVKWLEKRAPERWPGDKVQIEQKNIYELDASDRIGNIIALMAQLQQRAELSSGSKVIDVEASEPEDQ